MTIIYPDNGTGTDTPGMNFEAISPVEFTIPAGVTSIDKIGIQLHQDESAYEYVGLIYSESGGTYTKLAETACLSPANTTNWQDFDLTSSLSVSPSDTLYGAWWSNAYPSSGTYATGSNLNYQSASSYTTCALAKAATYVPTATAYLPGWNFRLTGSEAPPPSSTTVFPPPPVAYI